MSKSAERLAFDLAEAVGGLRAVVTWCVDHSHECLADHPAQLAIAKRILKETSPAGRAP